MIIKSSADSHLTPIRIKGRPLHFDYQQHGDAFCVWSDDGYDEAHTVAMRMTGEEAPDNATHIGTAMNSEGTFVLHAYVLNFLSET